MTEESRSENLPPCDCDITEGYGGFFDWVEELDEDRKLALSQLADRFGDILDVDTESAVISYKGGVRRLVQDAIDSISQELKKDVPNLWNIMKISMNPLDTDFLFLEESSYSADQSLCFVDMLLGLDKGDRLFVGGIYRYHY